MNRFGLLVLLSGLCLTSFCSAQTATGETLMLDLPRQSQHALLTQRIGLTDITINYHRPLANGRQIWGKVVPYGQVWRAGANENTTIAFSDPVTIEGQPLDKGTYGLHMIPGENQWTAIFSKNSTSWGSFTYKQDEDALRVNVKPQAAELHDALGIADFAVLVGRIHFRGKGSGVESTSPAGWMLKFRDGKLLRFRAFGEPAQALESVGLAG